MNRRMSVHWSFIVACFFCIQCYSQVEYVQSKKCNAIKLNQKSTAKAIWVRESNLRKLCSKNNLPKLTEEFTVTNCGEEVNNEHLDAIYKRMPNLKTAGLYNAKVYELPDAIYKCEKINKLLLVNCPNLDYDSLFIKLNDFPNITSVVFNMSAIDEVPFTISNCKNLKSLTLLYSKDVKEIKNGGEYRLDTLIQLNPNFSKLLQLQIVSSTKINNSDLYQLIAAVKNSRLELPKQVVQYKDPIVPPINENSINKELFVINPNKNTTLVANDGSVISIPKNSIVNKNGKPIKQEVTIEYRTYKNPVEFMFSNIPMSFDSANNKTFFASAGMFELNAFIGDEKAYLKKNETINVKFVSTSQDTGFRFYNFDSVNKSWVDLNQNINAPNKNTNTKYRTSIGFLDLINGFTNPVSMYYYFVELNNYTSFYSYAPMIYDSTEFNERFYSNSYAHLLHKRSNYPQSNNKDKSKLYSYSPEDFYKIKRVKKLKDNTVVLMLVPKINKNKKESDLNIYTTVSGDRMIRSVYFKTLSPLSYSEFKSKKLNQTISEFRIINNGNTVKLILKTRDSFSEIELTPVQYNASTKEISEMNKNMNRKFNAYNNLLIKKEKKFNRALNAGRLKYNKVKVDSLLFFSNKEYYSWIAAKRYMPINLSSMSFEEWKSYAEKHRYDSAYSNSSDKSKIAIRNLTLSGFGLYNCDVIKRISNKIEVFAEYTIEGKEANISRIFLVDYKLNAIIQYNGNTTTGITFGTTSENAIAISSTSKTLIVGMDENGRLVWMSAEDVKAMNLKNNQKVVFDLRYLPEEYYSVSDINKFLAADGNL